MVHRGPIDDSSAPPRFSGPLEVRPGELQVFADGRRLHFTRREFELLWALLERDGRVVSRMAIYDAVWGGRMRPRERAVDTLVRQVRGKLAGGAPEWQFIHTHYGIGYRFAAERRGE